jgi:hypothetical protein
MGMGTFAYRIGSRENPVLIGANIKYAHEIFDGSTTMNVGLDIGGIIPSAIPFISIGLAVTDINMVIHSASGKFFFSNPTLKISWGGCNTLLSGCQDSLESCAETARRITDHDPCLKMSCLRIPLSKASL